MSTRKKTAAASPVAKLLREARAQVHKSEGAVKVAAAISSATRITVAQVRKLMDRPLTDPKLALRRGTGIKEFKAALGDLVPSHRGAIARLAVKPKTTPAGIAREVDRLIQVGAAQPLSAAPAVYVKSASAEARKRCADALGKDFAAKASDRLVTALGTRMMSGLREAAAEAVQAMVLEFDDPAATAPRSSGARALREGGGAESWSSGARSESVRAACDAFFAWASPIRAELERAMQPAAAGRRFRESATDLGSATDVCWLNGSVRATSAPRSVADVAADRRIVRIGIPLRLERELRVSANTVKVAPFRTAQGGLTGAGVRVAVIDGEVDASHAALAGRVSQKKNYTDEAWGNPDLHGTAVGAIIGSAARGLAGMAPGAAIYSYKVFSTDPTRQGSDFDAALAVQQALEDGAQVANCSWGVGQATTGTSRVARAFNRAWDLGLILVKSAGNRGPNAGTLTSPADASGVIVVGATGRRGTALERYSSRGPIPAKPGPDLLAPGASPTDSLMAPLAGGGTGAVGHGTSYAAPHITGIIALLLEQNGNLSPDQVKAALLAKCRPLTGNTAAGGGAGLIVLA